MERNFEEKLSEAIDRMIAGAALQDVLASYPDDRDELRAALRDAQTLLRSGPPSDPPSAGRAQARERMLTDLHAARHKAEELRRAPETVPAGVATSTSYVSLSPSQERSGWLKGFTGRSASFRAAAVAGSVALVGVLGIGAAAATGNAPEPVREFFGASSSALRVEFDGVIVATDAGAQTFDVDVAGDVRTVRVVGSTELSRGGDAIAFDQFAVGDPVEVKGALQPDDTIIASRVHLEDDVDDDPEAGPTIDDDDEDDQGDDDEHEDNTGPGNADDADDADDADEDDDEDSFGPGSDDDDGEEHDDATPESDDDDSHAGSIDDDAEDDTSGPGSVDDESDDSADTDDDEAEDDSGSDSESDDGGDDEPDDD